MTLRLLLVHAHPDDETLTHGATLAAALAHGHEVDLVTCTRGEEGEVIGPQEAHRTSDRDDTLAELRVAELEAALEALGRATGAAGRVAHAYLDDLPPVPGTRRPWPRYRDSGMAVLPGGRAGVPPDVRPECFAVADVDEAAGRLAGLVRRRRPHVVLTYGPHGGYGHPDHVMTHRVTLRALHLAEAGTWTMSWAPVPAGEGPGTQTGAGPGSQTGAASQPGEGTKAGAGSREGSDGYAVPWVYGAAGDADELRAWLRGRADPRAWDPDGPLPQMFVPPAELDATVRAGRWLPAKVAALRQLPSQVTVLDDHPDRAVLALSNDVPQPLTGTEHAQLLRAVGPCDDAPTLDPGDPLAPLLLPPGTRPGGAPRADQHV